MQYSGLSCMMMHPDFRIFLLVILSGMVASVVFKKLTPPAAITGGILSCCIYAGAGFAGITLMAAFFVLGVLATSWKLDQKISEGLAEAQKGKRTAAQVFANAGMAAITGLITWILPELRPDAPLIIAACFASATADTISSELGNVYGKRFYHILSLKKATGGANGVISLEGTLAGCTGSCIISVIYAFWQGWSIDLLFIVIAGTLGNFIDSILGATLENTGYISNNAVNFFNTCAAAVFILILNLMRS
ncbi:DUF92 domain-containing protein [Niabella yanshanensis]|uniref:DUF92 domain-containing protein n=1 Tax=Niabella yanshanensis TaxID=577386 RepID=A0ABZ0W973_9BACT|nr:DUF92 domain-containing protein [Niabella yanshanensis]WQD39830.1 DUF92 domain-containing protein [Niabella yanshanensis]